VAGAFWDMFASSEKEAHAVIRRSSFVLTDVLDGDDILEELIFIGHDGVFLRDSVFFCPNLLAVCP
jgi:hypothetical protein